MEADVKPPAAYAIVFIALLVLLGMTIAFAFVDLGHALGLTVALGVAALKAALIILYFMHVLHAPNRIRMVALVGFVWLGIMAALTMSDYLTRGGLATGPHVFRDPNNVQR